MFLSNNVSAITFSDRTLLDMAVQSNGTAQQPNAPQSPRGYRLTA
jgi:hypothetical protein